MQPISALRQAIRAVPAVKYALGVAGVVAAVALVQTFRLTPTVAVFGTVVMLLLMTVLVLFARLVRTSAGTLRVPVLVLTWFSLLMVMATAVAIFTSVFWQAPLNFQATGQGPHVTEVNAGTQTRHSCYPYDPLTDLPDRSLPERPCLAAGRLTYIKWWDKTAYPGTDPLTGRWPNDRPNRALAFAQRDDGGNNVWSERNLFRIDGEQPIWQPAPPKGNWIEIVGSTTAVVTGQAGLLLRRENSKCDPATRMKEFYDAFVPLDIDLRVRRGEHVDICFRKVRLACDPALPLGTDIPPRLEPQNVPFDICKGPVLQVRRDG